METYEQHLAKQISVRFSIESVKEVELISAKPVQVFPKKIFIEEKSQTIDIAKSSYAKHNFWCDKSKLD